MLLIDDRALPDRRRAAAGALRALAASLTADFEAVMASGVEVIPRKARLTRAGGRCAKDGTLLVFDPFSPDRHRCERCGAVYEGEVHHEWWLMSYHLWLAERAVHGAILHCIGGDPRHAAFARAVLDAFGDTYLQLPNRDNVLGPSRPFFSTYLESIWLLQLCVAADALAAAGDPGVRDRFVERVMLPSAELIASFDEGESNRQIWNDAALLAAAALIRDHAAFEHTLFDARGLVARARRGLLVDGSWYEGENYHQFAHRGLWYAASMAAVEGVPLPADVVARFDGAFAIPFLTALPDFTFPARRDSPWAVSLRQWRYAESAELGYARTRDARLLGALARLYADDMPRRETGRAHSAAESERNVPPSALSRADLGWRSLLHALPELPELLPMSPKSMLLEGQGLAVFRRDGGRTYVALDYGQGGGGHGHPDRLGVLLAHDATRWLDDPGTGSYVDPTLHWYRSTLAHNAPLAGGVSQWRVNGTLLAHEERGGAGWVQARSQLAEGVDAFRTLVVMPGYVVDIVQWAGRKEVEIDLPIHVDGDVGGARWRAAALTGGKGLEDGFRVLENAERTEWSKDGWMRLDARQNGARASFWMLASDAPQLWRATAPGPPGTGPRRFHLLRANGREGTIVSVWDVRGVVKAVARDGGAVIVTLADEVHRHVAAADGWRVELRAGDATSSIDLRGVRPAEPPRRLRTPSGTPRVALLNLPRMDRMQTGASESTDLPLRFELGGLNYRRSEDSWADAGEPTAALSVWLRGSHLVVHAEVHKQDTTFAPAEPRQVLDNEEPLIHGDGLQVHLAFPAPGGETTAGFLFAPRTDGDVRIRRRGIELPAIAVMEPAIGGYVLRAEIDLGEYARPETTFQLGIAINDMGPGRERRRGQLLLVNAADEYVYLQGDRLLPHHFLPIAIPS